MKKQPARTTAMKPRKKQTPTLGEPRDVTRHIRQTVESMLWGRAAGRCEFDGCNKLLSRSCVTQEQVNAAQKAHIYAFSDKGPRGNSAISKGALNDLDNLMLVCHGCHVKIDQVPDGGRYTATTLQDMKGRHERRIEIVTGITPDRRSHVLLYGANIGERTVPLNLHEAAGAMFPDRYPAEPVPIALGTANSSYQDRTDHFWQVEKEQLRNHFDRRVGGAHRRPGDFPHVSLCPRAAATPHPPWHTPRRHRSGRRVSATPRTPDLGLACGPEHPCLRGSRAD